MEFYNKLDDIEFILNSLGNFEKKLIMGGSNLIGEDLANYVAVNWTREWEFTGV